MATAIFHFYAELNELLPSPVRQREILHEFRGPVTIKDRIEDLGMPHTEEDYLQVNSKPADFAYRLQDGDRVSVHPFLAILANPLPLRPPQPPRSGTGENLHRGSPGTGTIAAMTKVALRE